MFKSCFAVEFNNEHPEHVFLQKHMLPQYCTTYNNVFLLITSTKV